MAETSAKEYLSDDTVEGELLCRCDKKDETTTASGTENNRRKLIVTKRVIDDAPSNKGDFSVLSPRSQSKETELEDSKLKCLAPVASGLPFRYKIDHEQAKDICQKIMVDNNPHPTDTKSITKISRGLMGNENVTKTISQEEIKASASESDKRTRETSDVAKSTKRKEQYKRSRTVPSTYYSNSLEISSVKSHLKGGDMEFAGVQISELQNKDEEMKRPFRSLESLRDKNVPRIVVHEIPTLEDKTEIHKIADSKQGGQTERYNLYKQSEFRRKVSASARRSVSFDSGKNMVPLSADFGYNIERRASFDCIKPQLNPIPPKRQSLPEETLTKSLRLRRREIEVYAGASSPLNPNLPVPLQCTPPLSPPPRKNLTRQEEILSPKTEEEYSRHECLRRKISREFMSLDALESPREALEFDFSDGEKITAYFKKVEKNGSLEKGKEDGVEARRLAGTGRKSPKLQRRYSEGKYQELRLDTPTPPIYLPPIDNKCSGSFLSLPPVHEKQKRRYSEGQMLRKLAAESDDVTEKLSHLALSPRLSRRAETVKGGNLNSRAKKYTLM